MDKERPKPQIPDIPGVIKGEDFLQRRQTIESKGLEWAAKRRSEFSEKDEDLLIISEKAKSFFELPVLTLGEKCRKNPELSKIIPLWVPRFDPTTGSVFTSRWRKPSLYKDENGKRLKNPEKYIVFAGRKKDKNPDLKRLPKFWSVAVFVPSEVHDGLEAAMRQQDVIRHDYGTVGVEFSRIVSLYREIFQISEVFKEGEIYPGVLNDWSKKTENLLKKENLINATDSLWEKISKLTLRSVQKDSLNRINPMISRVLARAAFLNVVSRELINNAIKEKASKTYTFLAIARENVRFQIWSAAATLGKLGGFLSKSGRGDVAFTGEGEKIFQRDALRVSEIIRLISKNLLLNTEVAPYLIPARLAEAILLGESYKSKAAIVESKKILDLGKVSSEIKRESVEYYLRFGKRHEAKRRLRNAYEVLTSVLNDPENKVTAVF